MKLRQGRVTGQVDFDSHTSGIVAATADVINLLTPGWVSGREYRPPTGPELVTALGATLPTDDTAAADTAQIAEFAGYVRRLRQVFELVAGGAGDVDAACEITNGLLRDSGAIPVLARHEDKPWHLHFHPLDAGWARSWAGPMTVAVATVLGSAAWDRLGVCSAPGCEAVYVDTSRNGAKKFCDTACQNRVKAAAFRERHRTAAP
jgi:predicted RNA-binding Zn ribbon-like protein